MALNSQSIKTMFATQQFRTSQYPIPLNKNTISQFLEEKESEEVSENTETIEARAVRKYLFFLRSHDFTLVFYR